MGTDLILYKFLPENLEFSVIELKLAIVKKINLETNRAASDKHTADYEALKLRMTVEATNMISAEIIANKHFPQKKSLPKFFPLPFNNFGHFFLFDHRLFLHIIYQSVCEIKEIANARKDKYDAWFWAIGFLLGLSLILILRRTEFSAIYLVPLSAAIIAYFISLVSMEEKLNIQIADHKAAIIEKLLTNKWEENKELKFPKRLEKSIIASTNGIILNNEIPVLVMVDDLDPDDQQPFPGFGKLQLDNKFICPPKKFDSIVNKDEFELFEDVMTKLQMSLVCCGIKNLGFKKVIVINSDSLSIDSSWLDEEKVPFLTKNMDLADVFLLDKNASVRVYIIVEVLFPKYDSAACFFIRPFMAENSAGWHLAITTIGPPQNRQPYLNDRLWRYNMEKTNGESNSISSSEYVAFDIPENAFILNKLQSYTTHQEKFHEKISLSTIRNLDITDEKMYDESFFEKKVKKIIENEISWPGKYYYVKYNVRERKSLTFGGDFFGYPELTSSILTVYDQISIKILEAIEEQGFDISKYKDKEGKFSINAESIDKIIVGEVINMKQDKKKQASSDNSQLRTSIDTTDNK